MTKQFLTKTRWLVTILLSLSIGQMWGTTSVTGTYKLVTSTTGIAAGDTVLLVNKAGDYALTGISTTSTKYGLRQSVTSSNGIITLTSADVEELKVETGYNSSGFSFKGTGDITNYLYWTTGNSLNQNSTKSANTSWTLDSYSDANGMTIKNNQDNNRIVKYNTANNQQRFACYTTSQNLTLVNLYKKVYAVKYDKNGGGGSAMTDSNSPYTRNTTVTVLSCTFTAPDGKVFDKWNTKADGSGKDYDAGDTFSAVKDVTLYAQWESAASCSTKPELNGAANNGTISSSSIPVKCTGITSIGDNCSLTSYGFVWAPTATTTTPTLSNSSHQVGTSIATSTEFSYTITGLNASTSYTIRSYATNGNGTQYGSAYTVTTLAACTAAPTVGAGSSSNVTKNSATVTCLTGITSLGTGGCAIESYGFVYGTSQNPTTSNNKVEVGTTYTTTGTSFNANLTGLAEGQTYYVRPYATNGYDTEYGTQTSFGTPKITVVPAGLVVAFGDKKVGGTYTETFTVSGQYLQGNITLTPSSGCSGKFSIDKNSITPTDGIVTNEVITVTYTPTTAGNHGGGGVYINVESTNAQLKSVMPTGTGKWEVTWNNNGSTSTTLVANNEKPTFPSTPSACDANSTTFIGWATAPWSGKIQNLSGKTVHTVNSTMSNIIANGTTYYAVFAKDGSKAVRVTDYTSLAAGTAIVIVNNYSSSRYILLSTFATAQTPTYSGDDISISNSNQYWWLTGNNSDGFTLKSGDGKTLGTANTNSQTLVSNTTSNSLWTFGALTGDYSECISMTNKSATYPIEYSSGWKIYNTSSESWMAMRIYKVNFSDFITTCCDKNVALSGGSPSNGTITFKDGVNAVTSVATCGGNKTITMEITPAAGYKLTAWSTSSSTVTPTDTDPSVAITGDDSKSEQTITLTFAQGASGNYTGAATFTAMTDYFIDKLHYDVNTAYEDPGVSMSGTYTVPTPSNGGDPSDDSCAELHYKFVGWVPESDVNSSGGVTSTANMLTAGTANHAASDITYYAIWAKEQ